MREVFKPGPDGKPAEKVFYTLTAADVGPMLIKTTVGVIAMSNVLGRVLPEDVGCRLYRVRNNADDHWLWVAETRSQRDERLRLRQVQMAALADTVSALAAESGL